MSRSFRIRWVAALGVALWFLPLIPVRAQEVDSLPLLPPGAVVRVGLADGSRAQGLLVSRDRVSLTLRENVSLRRVPIDQVQRIWVRHRSTRTGALVGGAVGALGGALLLNTFVRGACESPSDCNVSEATLFGLGVGGASGALVGAVIGAAFPHWRLEFP